MKSSQQASPRIRFFLFGLAGLCLVALLLGRVILFPAIKSGLRDYLAREHQLALNEVEMGGSLIGDLRLTKIRAMRIDKSATVAELTIASLRVDYSLLDLLQGLDIFLAKTRITIDGGSLVLDLAGTGEESPALALPAHLPRIVGRNLSLVLRHGDHSLLLAGCDFSVAALVAGQGQPLKLASRAISFGPADGKTGQVSGSLSGWYRPEALVLEKLILNGEDIPSTGRFLFEHNGAPASFAAGLKAFGGELNASGTLGPEQSEFSLGFTALELAELALFFPSSRYVLSGKVSGKAEARDGAAGLSGSMDGAWQGTINGENIVLSCQVVFKGDTLDLNRLALELGGNRLTVADATVPLSAMADPTGLLSVVSLDHFAARLDNIPALWKAAGRTLKATSLPTGHLLELEGRIRDKSLILTQGSFTGKKNSLILSQAKMELPEAGQSFFSRQLAGTFRFSFTDLRELALLTGLPVMDGSLRGTGEISGTLQAPTGRVSVLGEKLSYQGCPLGDLSLEAKADGRQIQIVSARMKQQSDSLRFSGRYSPARQRVEALEGEVSIRDLGYYVAAGKVFDVDLSGSLQASITKTQAGSQEIFLRLRNGHLAAFSFAKADLRLATDDWRRFTCEEGRLETPYGNISLSGSMVSDLARQSLTVQLRQLVFSRGGARFATEKLSALTLAYGAKKSLAIDHLLLRGPAGSLAANGRLAWQGAGDFTLRASGLRSGEWLKGLLAPGYDFNGLELHLAIQGPLARAKATLAGSVAALVCPQSAKPFAGEVDLEYSPAGLRLKKLALSNALGQQLSLSGFIPYDPLAKAELSSSPDFMPFRVQTKLMPLGYKKNFLAGPLAVKGYLSLPGLARRSAGTAWQGISADELAIEMNLGGSWLHPVGRASLKAKNLTAPRLQGLLPPEPLMLDCALVLEGDRLNLQGARLVAAGWTGEFSGDWFGLPTLPGLLTNPPPELPGSLAITGTVRLADLGWLAGRSNNLRRLSGRLETTFSLHGKAAQPQLSGSLSLRDGALRFANSTLPNLDNLRGKADFARETLNIHNLEGLMGGGPFTVAGSIALAGDKAELSSLPAQTKLMPFWYKSRFDIKGKGRNLLFFRDADLKIRGDADLRLTGPLARLDLSGDLVVTDGSYRKKFDFLTLFKGTVRPRRDIGLQALSLPDPPFRDMAFGVKVSAGQPFLVRNNLIKGSVRPAFRLVGTGEAPALVGRILVDPTTISLPAGRLVIETGVINFPENDPDRPTFDLTAKSRMAGYDIDLRFEGTADEPVITLSSQPPLPDSDLLLLVLAGQPPSAGTGSRRRQPAGMNMAVYLGKGLLADWFGIGATESDESIIDRFELDLGRQITSSGEDTLEARFRLAEGVLFPNDRLLLIGERDVYDNYNVGVKIVFRFK